MSPASDESVPEESVSEDLVADESASEEDRERFRLPDLVVAIVVGLFFAVSAWGALGNLIGVPRLMEAAGRPSGTPWVTLIASLAAPVVLFIGGLLVGRGRPSFPRALILVAALAANSAVGLTLYFLSLSALPA